MSVYLFTVSFQAVSLIPKDNMINTFHFEGDGSDYVNVADMLTDFYEDTHAGGVGSIASYISSRAYTGQITIKAYNLDDASPRAPRYSVIRNLVGLANVEFLPTEVALVMSYNSQITSGVQPARRRGRIYIGGLATVVSTSNRPSTALRGDIARAGRDLIQASNASGSWDWVQYSPTTDSANIVVVGWVDNSWDTQRRRGVAPTARTAFTGGTP